MNEVKIIENFLNENDFLNIKNILFSHHFPWFFNNKVVTEYQCEDLDNFQFTHIFYNNNQVNSNHFELVAPIVRKIDPLSLLKIKANLLPRTLKNIEHGMHVDYKDPKVTTSVFYINNNDGYTIFENGEKIFSKENTLVVFPSQIYHSGSTCTNEKARVVLNINYIEKTK